MVHVIHSCPCCGQMASAAAEPLATHCTTSDADDDDSSISGSELPSGGASQCAKAHACRRGVQPGWRPPSPDDLLDLLDQTLAGQDVRGQAGDGRGRVEDDDHGAKHSSSEASSAGQSCADPGSLQPSEQPEAAVLPVTSATLAARASAVFDASAGWPTEVRKPLLAPVVTNLVVRAAIAVCDDLCDRDGDTLSQAFGNFDRRVAIGWLLADAAGRPLLDRAQAHALGIKAQRADGAAKAAIRDARKKAIGPARAAGTDVSKAQDEAEAVVLCADAKVLAPQQPSAELPAAAPAARAPTGSRKRAREPEPSHEAEVQEAEDALLQAEKQVHKAEKVLATAEAASDAAATKFQRLAARTDKDASMSFKLSQEHARKVEAACQQSDAAELAEKDAEIALLRAQLVERDANIDLLMLQWGHTCQQLDSSVATASTALSSAKRLHEIAMFRSSEHGSTVESDGDL